MRHRRATPSFAASAQAGFSLIEIILVVVLIGGIVAFAANRILGGGDRAKHRATTDGRLLHAHGRSGWEPPKKRSDISSALVHLPA